MGKEAVPRKNAFINQDILQKNDMSYSKVMMSCESEICFGIIEKARTSILTEGDEHISWQCSQTEYILKLML